MGPKIFPSIAPTSLVQSRQALTGVVGTTNIDLSQGSIIGFTFGAGNETLTLSNLKDSEIIALAMIQDGVGSRTVTWPAAIKWVGGSAPTLSTGANKRDQFTFTCNGTILSENSRALDVR